jgi:D-methionine transport system substrate-binding protein
MKKWILGSGLLVLVLAVAAAHFLGAGQAKAHTLVVAATPVPHAEILRQAKALLAKQAITLEIVVVNDYVTPNLTLADGSIDANYFQHWPYLDDFCAAKKLALSSLGAVHFEPLGLYSQKIKRVQELKDGDSVAIPNDVSNESRALSLLAAHKILTLKDPQKLTSTKLDVASYAVKITLVELEAAQLTRGLSSVTAAIINGNYAIDAGLNPARDALAIEDAASPSANTYANIIAIRKGEESRQDLQKLLAALQSPEIRAYITQRYKGAVLAVRP